MDIASVDHVLTTTRSVRKRLDLTRPVDPRVVQECIEIAVQAPNGGNPSDILIQDRPLLLNTVLWLLVVLLIIYGLG